MPTPSDNTPIEAISTRTCPEPDRSVWRDSEHSEPIDVISPERAAEPSALSRSDDGSVLAPTKAAKLTIVDDEPEPIRATSPAESTCIRSQSPTLPQPSSSLLSWEFSNVRVSTDSFAGSHATNLLLTIRSFCQITHPPSCAPAANSSEHNKAIARFTMLMSRSNTSIWLSPISAVTFESKVCDSLSIGDVHGIRN